MGLEKLLYRDYFQKSRVFLYPALDIRRGGSVTPIQTYVSWADIYLPEDRKFVCLYHLRDDEDFMRFEKQKLLGNKHFHDFKEVGDEKGAYVFDYRFMGVDWDHFISGKYSKMSEVHKSVVRQFYGTYSSSFVYIESMLYPEKYYEKYSKILNVDVGLLEEVGELCSIPDLTRERLVMDVKPIILKTDTL
jgi:hypothetical protein